MIVDNINDLNELPEFVIVGSGPASISLALKLEKNGIKCLIIEAGGLERTLESQSNYQGDTFGDPYSPLDSSRGRWFGGFRESLEWLVQTT